MRIDTVQSPAAQPPIIPQKNTMYRSQLPSTSSISGSSRPNFLMQLPFALFRMCTFVLSLLIHRTPRLKNIYIPDMTPAAKIQYEKTIAGYWTDFGFFRKGLSYSQKIQLFHQYNSFQKHAVTWIVNDWTQKFMTIIINGKKHKLNFEQEIPKDVKLAFLKIISNPDHFEKGKDAKVELQFELRSSFDFGIGPYREKRATLTTKNTLGVDGKSFTSEITNKRLRTRYRFFS